MMTPAVDQHKWKNEDLQLLNNEAFCELVQAFGARKVLFGTDSPWAEPEQELRKIRDLPLSKEDIIMILGENLHKNQHKMHPDAPVCTKMHPDFNCIKVRVQSHFWTLVMIQYQRPIYAFLDVFRFKYRLYYLDTSSFMHIRSIRSSVYVSTIIHIKRNYGQYKD